MHRVELREHVLRRRRARHGPLREQPLDEIRELGREIRPQVREPRRRLVGVAAQLLLAIVRAVNGGAPRAISIATQPRP